MRSYKLIKQYPACSWEIGDVITYSEGKYMGKGRSGTCYCFYESPSTYPEFWQEITEPNYPTSWDELESRGDINGYSLGNNDVISSDYFCKKYFDTSFPENILHTFADINQAKSALAFAQLTQLHKAMIDEYNRINSCDWKPDWAVAFSNYKYSVTRQSDSLGVAILFTKYHSLCFPTKELGEFSLTHHEKLWKQYYQIE